jgi:hypothetical protein
MMTLPARARPLTVHAVLLSGVAAVPLGSLEALAADQLTTPGQYQSAFSDYRSYAADAPLLPWREANDRAAGGAGHGAHGTHGDHGDHAPPTSAEQAAPAEQPRHTHGDHANAPAAVEPTPDEATPTAAGSGRDRAVKQGAGDERGPVPEHPRRDPPPAPGSEPSRVDQHQHEHAESRP